LVLAGGAILGGCSTSTFGDHMPTAAGGLPVGAPQRPATTPAYPAVYDAAPAREKAALTEEEQRKLDADLAAARDRASGKSAKPAASPRNP
jgi:hypothetical protein